MAKSRHCPETDPLGAKTHTMHNAANSGAVR